MFIKYSFNLAIQSIWREKWINLLSILNIGVGLFIISLIALVIFNVDLFTRNLPEKFSMMVYLKDGITEDETHRIISNLKKNDQIINVKYISKDAAMKELKATIRNAEYIFEGLDENPLFASIELRLKKQHVSVASVKKISSEILKINGVSDVEYGEKFLAAIHSIKTGVQKIGIFLIALLSIGVTFICYSTVKILFYRKMEEVEIFKLLGATRGFIRAPFLIEGCIVGMLGSMVSLSGIGLLRYALYYKLSLIVPFVGALVFPRDIFLMPFIGLFLGMTGAMIALGRIRY